MCCLTRGGGIRAQIQAVAKDAQQLPGPILCGFVTLLVFRGTLVGRNVYSVHAAQDLSALHGIHLEEGGGGSSNEALRRMLNVENKEEEENDPPPRDPNVPYTLGPEIKDWNDQRALWMSKNLQMAKTSNDKDLILLVSGSKPKPCDNPVGDHYLVKAMKNKIDYSRFHDIEFFSNMAYLDQEMSGFWSKLPLIRKLMLAHPEVGWIWWMDSDAMFTDMVSSFVLRSTKTITWWFMDSTL